MYEFTYTTAAGIEGKRSVRAASEQEARGRFAESFEEYGEEVPSISRVEGPWAATY